jgi:signal transduction histidine kinase
MRFTQELRSHLQYKIILPFLILTLLVAIAGAATAFMLITSSAQERLNNQLAQAARSTSDAIVTQERANLVFLREMAFASANPANNAPAVADALQARDLDGLSRALEPYFRNGRLRPGVRLDRLIAFDTQGQALIDWEMLPSPNDSPMVDYGTRNISELWFVPLILQGQYDEVGDKYAGLLEFNNNGTSSQYLFSVAPVTRGDEIVGGLIVASRLDNLLQTLNATTQTAIIAVYDAETGQAFASSALLANGLAELNMRPEIAEQTRRLEVASELSYYDTVSVNERQYQFAYVPLRVRNSLVGLLSVGLARDYVVGPWSDAVTPLMFLTIVLMLMIIGLGVYIARQITRPLQELVDTAQAVTAGDLERRSQVTVQDEVGVLSESFNNMTAHLLNLYSEVHAEASRRAAIVESITDGVIMCDPSGQVQLFNRATRTMLKLADDEPGPQRIEDIPLVQVTDPALAFGETRAHNLYNLHEYIVRVTDAPVVDNNGVTIGVVYLLQDLTSEVAMDRAKTNFIATISHELRTPLTVLGGNTELLLRNLMGPLSDEQRVLVEAMRKHTLGMTALLNNVITIAGLESGTLTFDMAPVAVASVVKDALWSQRSQMIAKGLELEIDVPEDLPLVFADSHQLRSALQQLLDNAKRYTQAGKISIRATHEGDDVRIDISDTGQGISEELSPQLFTRFSRGEQGINSAERGIGLGLTIARQLIERQGGSLWLESTSEQGSTFSLKIPCAKETLDEHCIATAA